LSPEAQSSASTTDPQTSSDGQPSAAPGTQGNACSGNSCGTPEAVQNQKNQTAQPQAEQQPQTPSGSQQPQTTTQQQTASNTTMQMAGGNRTPSSGQPDTTERVPGASPGSYTERTYGPDGRATVDIDHGHDHKQNGDPHAHDWVGGKRQPPRNLTPDERARADTHRFSAWVSDNKGAILATVAVVVVVGSVALAPATGGASLAGLAFAP